MNKKNTFNEKIKNEICTIKYDDQRAFFILWSLFINNIQLKVMNQEITYVYQSSSIPIIKLIKIISNQLGIKIINPINIVDDDLLNKQKILELAFDQSIEKIFSLTNPDFSLVNNEQKKQAFLIGAYLSTGTISYSLQKSSYHFEIKSHKKDYIDFINSLLNNDFCLESKIITHRGYYVVYFKKAQYISDILKIFNAINSMYEFEDFRIKRDFVNSNQRLNNLDISNLNKTVKAGYDQIQWIKFLKENGYFCLLSNKVKKFAEIRLSNPDLSLNDLVDLYESKEDIKITRSTLNYYVNSIKNLYLDKNKNK